MNQQSEHLSNAQIEQYGNQNSGAGTETDEQVEHHLASCPECRSRLLEFQRAQFAFLPDPDLNTAITSECPGEDDLRQLAAGLCSENVALKLAAHAATCNHCGPLLREYTEDFADELSPEAQAAAAELESASPSWQEQTAREMLRAAGATALPATAQAAADANQARVADHAPVATSRGKLSADSDKLSGDLSADLKKADLKENRAVHVAAKSPRRLFSWKWMMVPATAAAGVIALGIWYTQRDTPEKVEKLLAQAYTEQRTMEMRWPGAEWGDFKQSRAGVPQSLLSSPAALRNAAEIIDKQLKEGHDKSSWLMLKARLDLLDWRYKPALSALDQIDVTAVTDSAEFIATRSLALFERAEIEHDNLLYRDVVDLTGKSLQKKPNDATAIFNQALACEKLLMYECAIQDYERLLKSDPDSGWSLETRSRLSRIREKKTPE